MFKKISILVVSFLSPTLIAQETSDAMRIAAERIYLHSDVGRNPALTRNEFGAALRSASKPGGVVSDLGCANETPLGLWVPAGNSLASALDTIISLDRTSYWTMSDGVLNLLPKRGNPAVMAVTIGRFEWETSASVQLTVQRLFQDAAVRKQFEVLGLVEGVQSITLLQKAPRVDGHPVAPEKDERRAVENVTLLNALNAVVASYGKAVWSYEERVCGNEKTFRITVQ